MTKCIIHSNIKLCEGGDTVVEETIKEIRKTEQEAEEIAANAKSQGAQILQQAKQETERAKATMIENAQEKAKANREAAQAAGERRLAEALKSAEKEIAEIKRTAKEKEKQAVQAVIESLI
ncbi:MAG: hypothetical protein KHY34_02785 [Lachnospiraceae bacterium]|nr:hypothetical protein [Lachnospiraceae bacterium]